MNSSKPSNLIFFFAIAAGTLMAAAIACLELNRTVVTDGGWRIVYDRTRVAIDPSNQSAQEQLIRDELETNLPAHALKDLSKVCSRPINYAFPCGSLTAAVLIVGGGVPALTDTVSPTTSGSQTDAEATRAFATIHGSQIAQAQELYVLGLPRSSQRIATKISQPSVTLYLLRGELETAIHGDRGAGAALADYQQALKLNPASKTVLAQALAVSRQTANASLSSNYAARLQALE